MGDCTSGKRTASTESRVMLKGLFGFGALFLVYALTSGNEGAGFFGVIGAAMIGYGIYSFKKDIY